MKRYLPIFALSALGVLCVSAPIAHAENHEVVVEPPAAVERWYSALGSVDRKAFEELIAEDAKIILKDLGIEQTKAEFISALDQWEATTGGATVIYKYQDITDNGAQVLVCYRFKKNELLTSENFTISGNQISGSVQEPRGESCSGF